MDSAPRTIYIPFFERITIPLANTYHCFLTVLIIQTGEEKQYVIQVTNREEIIMNNEHNPQHETCFSNHCNVFHTFFF